MHILQVWEIANEIIETKTSDRIVEQECSNEMIEKTPEERIKELEAKVSLLSRENEAYKKILNTKEAKKSMESTSRNFGRQKRSNPKGMYFIEKMVALELSKVPVS